MVFTPARYAPNPMASPTSRTVLAQAARTVVGLPAAGVSRLRQHPPEEHWGLALTVVLALASTLAGWRWSTWAIPPAFLALPFLLGGLLLTTRSVRRLALAVFGCLVFDVAVMGLDEVRLGAVVVVLASGLLAHEYARSRDETGLSGMSADSVLVQLRSRLEQQGELPTLPAPWSAEAVVEPAGGGPFAGDFVVSALLGDRFAVALVDVSGKGVEAGTRSLLLSGAMGGLLGVTSSEEFLSAANAYLVRQDWEEGFATALHLTVDLPTGDFVIGSAGHPPVAHLDAGSGRWALLDTEGPALGLMLDTSYRVATGRLRPGDALLLYTDGLVERPGRDLDRGIDKLLGEAERLVTQGFVGGGRLLVRQVAGRHFDDRGLVLLWRSP